MENATRNGALCSDIVFNTLENQDTWGPVQTSLLLRWFSEGAFSLPRGPGKFQFNVTREQLSLSFSLSLSLSLSLCHCKRNPGGFEFPATQRIRPFEKRVVSRILVNVCTYNSLTNGQIRTGIGTLGSGCKRRAAATAALSRRVLIVCALEECARER